MTTYIVQILLFVALYFEVFLLLAFLEKGRTKREKKPLAVFPKVSVIVPCYNEERTVEKTLHSLLALEYPHEQLEIFAIDDGSTDGTWQILQHYAGEPRIRLIQKENGGKHTALNLGITHATGEIIGCLDADSTVAPTALTEIVRAFQHDAEVMAVTPAIKTRIPQNLLQRIQRAEYSLSVFMRRTLALIDGSYVTPGPFSFFRREVFSTLGTYREAHNTEDLEIAMRMQTHRMRIDNAPDAHVYTTTPAKLPALIRQRVRWTYGFLRNFMDYKHMLFKPSHGNWSMIVVPMAFFSIFSGLFLFAMMLSNAAEATAREFIRYDTIGFSAATPSVDWFYFNTGAAMFLIGALITLTLTLMILGSRIAGEKRLFAGDILLFFVFYGFIAPLWHGRAVWRAMRGKKTSWTGERNKLS